MKFERKGVGKIIIVFWRGGGCGSARDRGRDDKKLRLADVCGASALRTRSVPYRYIIYGWYFIIALTIQRGNVAVGRLAH